MIGKSFFVSLILSFLWLSHNAQANSGLPDPLTLEHALAYALDMDHPDMIRAQASIEQLISELSEAKSANGLEADLLLEAAAVESSPIALDQGNDDHIARLSIRKKLYDFGRSDLTISSAEEELDEERKHLGYLKRHRQIEIARHFFNVILSDLKYSWDNEAMAIAFVRFDNAKESYALNKLSDVELLEAENKYQDIRYQRYISETQQRATRALLAVALNKPDDLPSNLVTPNQSFISESLPEYEELLKTAMELNPQINLLTRKVESANKRMQAARIQMRPTLDAEVEVSEYSKEAGSNDEWRAWLSLNIPLLENDSMKASISRHRGQWLRLRAMLLDKQNQVRQRVLELWQNIRLLNTRREQMLLKMDFSELSLDRNRALYEMEVSTNLGDAMVEISEVRYKQAKTDFELTLAWMELNLLLGKEAIYEEK